MTENVDPNVGGDQAASAEAQAQEQLEQAIVGCVLQHSTAGYPDYMKIQPMIQTMVAQMMAGQPHQVLHQALLQVLQSTPFIIARHASVDLALLYLGAGHMTEIKVGHDEARSLEDFCAELTQACEYMRQLVGSEKVFDQDLFNKVAAGQYDAGVYCKLFNMRDSGDGVLRLAA